MSNILEEFDGTVDNRINDKTADYSIAKQDVGNTIKEGIALASLIPVANVDLIYPKDWITRDASYNVFISLQNNVNGDTTITQNWQPISGAGGTSVYSLEANGFANAYTSTNDSIEEYLDNVIYIISPDEANADSATYEINALGALPIKKLASGALSNLDSGDLAVAGYYALVWRDSYFYVIAGIETRVNNGLESVNGVIGLGGELVRNTTIDGAENELNVSNLSYASLGFVSGLDTALFQLAPNLFSYDYENSDSTEIIQFYPNVNQFYFYGQTSDYSVSLYNQPNNLFISSSDLINNNSQTIYQTFNGINIHSSNNLGDNNQIYNTSGYATINGSEGDLSHQAQVYSDANTGITLFSGTTDKSDDFISIEANKNSVVITNFTDDAKLETPELQLTGTIANDDTLTKVAVFDNSGNVKYRDTSSIITGGTVTSVGLTMPSAFTVSNSPITTSGDIGVTGAGAVSQYVRGDGSLANFPSTTGGGASVSYYLNGSISQGTIGGVTYKQLSRTAVLGSGTNFTINTNGYIASFLTDANDPALLLIPSGNWNFEMYFSASSSGGTPAFYLELYKYDGTTFTLIASGATSPEGITNGIAKDLYVTPLAIPETTLTATDRLAIRVYVNNSGRTITLHTEDNNLCQVITTFTTGLTALNGLTKQVQFFAVGTSGTDFGISSATDTHTFNLPTASATNRGALSSTDWSTFNGKLTPNSPITGATKTKITYDNNGLVTAGADIAASDLPSGIDAAKIADGSVSNTEFQYLDGVTSAIQTQLNGKEASFTTLPISKGGTNSSTALNNNRIIQSSGGAIVEASAITASRALKSDANGIPTHFDTTTEPSLTELSYVKGVTSAIQTQLNNKLDSFTLFIQGTSLSPADGLTYFMSSIPSVPNQTANNRLFKFSTAGTLNSFIFSLLQGTNGSGETVTISIRNNSTTVETQLGTFTSDFGANISTVISFTGLSISVNTTDNYTIKIACPTWTTNPTAWQIGGNLLITI